MRYFGSWLCLCSVLQAQQGFGLAFQGRLNYLTDRAEPVPTGWFSDAALGLTYKSYWWGAGFEAGLYWVYKGGPSEVRLPIVNQDFQAGQTTAYKAAEAGFRFGPRWQVFYPRSGLLVGYRYQAQGLVTDANRTLNRWYALLPLGLSLELPTSFGTTGASFYYDIGLTNHLRRPASASNGAYEGAKLRRMTIEIHVMWGETR